MPWQNPVHIAILQPLTEQQATQLKNWMDSNSSVNIRLWTAPRPAWLRQEFQAEVLLGQVENLVGIHGKRVRHHRSDMLPALDQQILNRLLDAPGFASDALRLEAASHYLMLATLALYGGVFLSTPADLPFIADQGSAGATPGFALVHEESPTGVNRAHLELTRLSAPGDSTAIRLTLDQTRAWISVNATNPGGLDREIRSLLKQRVLEALPKALRDSASQWLSADGLASTHPDLGALQSQRARLTLTTTPAPADATPTRFAIEPAQEQAIRIVDTIQRLRDQPYPEILRAVDALQIDLFTSNTNRAVEQAYYAIGSQGFETGEQIRNLLSVLGYLLADPEKIDNERRHRELSEVFQTARANVDLALYPRESFTFPPLDAQTRYEYFHCWIGNGALIEPLLPQVIEHARTLQKYRATPPVTRLRMVVDTATRDWLDSHPAQGERWSGKMSQAGIEFVNEDQVFADLASRPQALDPASAANLHAMYQALKQRKLYATATDLLRNLVPLAWGAPNDVFIYTDPDVRFDSAPPPSLRKMTATLGDFGMKFSAIDAGDPYSLRSPSAIIDCYLYGNSEGDASYVQINNDIMLMRQGHPLLTRLLRAQWAVFNAKQMPIWRLPDSPRLLNDFEMLDKLEPPPASVECGKRELAARQARALSLAPDMGQYINDYELATTFGMLEQPEPDCQVQRYLPRWKNQLVLKLGLHAYDQVMTQLYHRRYRTPVVHTKPLSGYGGVKGKSAVVIALRELYLDGAAADREQFLTDLVVTPRELNIISRKHRVIWMDYDGDSLWDIPVDHPKSDRDQKSMLKARGLLFGSDNETSSDSDDEASSDSDNQATGSRALCAGGGSARRRRGAQSCNRQRLEQELDQVEHYDLPPDATAPREILTRARITLAARGGDLALLATFAADQATETQWHDLGHWQRRFELKLASSPSLPLARLAEQLSTIVPDRLLFVRRGHGALLAERLDDIRFRLLDPLRLEGPLIYQDASELMRALRDLYGIETGSSEVSLYRLGNDSAAHHALRALSGIDGASAAEILPGLSFSRFRQLFSLDGDTLPADTPHEEILRLREHWQLRLHDLQRLLPGLNAEQLGAVRAALNEHHTRLGSAMPLDIRVNGASAAERHSARQAAQDLTERLRAAPVEQWQLIATPDTGVKPDPVLARLDAERIALRLRQAVEALLPAERRANWVPLLDTLKLDPDGDYSLSFINRRNPSETDTRRTQSPEISRIKAWIDERVAAVRQSFLFEHQSWRLHPLIGRAEAVNGLNSALSLQALMGFFTNQQRQRVDDPDESNTLKIALQIHSYTGLVQIVQGGAQDLGQFVQLWHTLASEAALSEAGPGVLSQASGKLNAAFSLLNIILDGIELGEARNDIQRAVFGTRLFFDSASLGLIGASMLGVEMADPLLVPLTGLGVGIGALAEVFSVKWAKAQAIGQYFGEMHDGVLAGGLEYDASKKLLAARPRVVIRTLDLTRRTVGFGTQYIDGGHWEGLIKGASLPDSWGDRAHAIDIYRQCGLPQQGRFPDGNFDDATLLLPGLPEAYLHWNSCDYGLCAGSYTSHAYGFAILDKLRGADANGNSFYFRVWPPFFEYALQDLRFEFIATEISVALDEQDRTILLPEPVQETRNLITYYLRGLAACYTLVLQPGCTLRLMSATPHQTEWRLDASALSGNVSIKSSGQSLTLMLGQLNIELPERDLAGKIRLLAADGAWHQLDLSEGALQPIEFDGAKWNNPDAELQQRIARHKISEHYVIVDHYRVTPTRTIGRAWYDTAARRYLYIDDTPDWPEASLITVDDDAWFHANDQKQQVLRVDLATRQVAAVYRADQATTQAVYLRQRGAQRHLMHRNPQDGEQEYLIVADRPLLCALRCSPALLDALNGVDRLDDVAAWLGARIRLAASRSGPRYGDREVASGYANWIELSAPDPDPADTRRVLWLRREDGLVLRPRLERLPADLTLAQNRSLAEGGEVFYFYSPHDQTLHRQVEQNAATRIELPGLSSVSQIDGLLYVEQQGRISQLDANGKLTVTAVGQAWLTQHPAWWTELTRLESGDNLVSVLDIKTADGQRALPVWWQNGQLVVAAPTLAVDTQMLGLDVTQRDAWLWTPGSATLQRQPLLDASRFASTFAASRLAVDAHIPAPQDPQSLAALAQTAHGLMLDLKQAIRLPCIRGVEQLLLGAQVAIDPQKLDAAAWAHYRSIAIAPSPVPLHLELEAAPTAALQLQRAAQAMQLSDGTTRLCFEQAFDAPAPAARHLTLPAGCALELPAAGFTLAKTGSDLQCAVGNVTLRMRDFFTGNAILSVDHQHYTVHAQDNGKLHLKATLATHAPRTPQLPAWTCELTLSDARLADAHAADPGRTLRVNQLRLPPVEGVKIMLKFALEDDQPAYELAALSNLAFRRRGT